jgi:hypothetical protein
MRVFKLLFHLGVIISGLACGALPKDEQLLEEFRNHRADFETLVRMFEEDKGLGRVGDSFTKPDDPQRVGVSAARIRDYRRLCNAVNAPNCIEGYDATFDRLFGAVEAGRSESKDPIWIHRASRGLSVSGASKGFMYSADPRFEIVADLDRVRPSRSGTWIRQIEGLWYIYFDYED